MIMRDRPCTREFQFDFVNAATYAPTAGENRQPCADDRIIPRFRGSALLAGQMLTPSVSSTVDLPEDVREQFREHGRAGGRRRAELVPPEARSAIARRAASMRWIRRRFGDSSFERLGLPGGDLVDAGLKDLTAGRVTPESLLVSIARRVCGEKVYRSARRLSTSPSVACSTCSRTLRVTSRTPATLLCCVG